MARERTKWAAAFYEDATGRKPVKEFLQWLGETDPESADTLWNKFRIFDELGWEESVKNGLLKHIEGKIFEIKVKRKQPRVLGFAWRKMFVAASAEMKNEDYLDPKTIKDAQDRRDDWIKRHGD